MKEIRVIIVEDHFLVRVGLKNTFSNTTIEDTKVKVVAEAASAEAFYKLLDNNIEADLVLLDLNLPDEPGFSIAKRIVEQRPDLKILVLSAESSLDTISQIMSIEIGGFISKDGTPAELFRAIESVTDGGSYYGKDIATLMHNVRVAKSEFDDLKFTAREKEILQLSAEGKYAKEIAYELGLNHKTVAVHKTNIFKKLGINSSVELVRYSLKMGFVKL